MTKPCVFYFSFLVSDSKDERNITKAFVISEEAMATILSEYPGKTENEKFDYFVKNDLMEIMEELEENFGVHDWATSPHDSVHAIGYDTYEVPETEIDNLMDSWRNYFIELSGGTYFPEVFDLGNYDNNWSDYDFYLNAIQKK